jgi:predicted PurR-regulated permease PerM
MKLEFSLRTWLALVALGPAIFLAIELLPVLSTLFQLLLVIGLLALLIDPLADRLEVRGVSRGLTVGATLVGGVLLMAGLVMLLLPALFNSMNTLLGSLDEVSASVQSWLNSVTGSDTLGNLSTSLIGRAAETVQWAGGQLGSLLGQIGTVTLGFIVAASCVYALVADKRTGPALLKLLVPQRYHARLISLTHEASNGLERWFVAQLVICAYYIVAYSVTNMLLEVPYGLQIGTVAGMLEFIPYLGGLVGVVLSALAAATVSPMLALIVLVVHTIIGSVCVYFVAPFAFSRAVEVPSALILIGLFVGGLIGGFFAALLTVPLICVALVVYRQLWPDSLPDYSAEEPERTSSRSTSIGARTPDSSS